jgi:putative ABC transport system permease protein
MDIGPIWRAALRNKTGAVLIIAQIAFTLALVVNGVAIVQERARLMARPSGLDEPNIFHLRSSGYSPDFDERLTIEEDLRELRGLPGIVSAVQSNTVPLSGGGWSMWLAKQPGQTVTDRALAAIYFVDEYGIDTLGLDLIAGENFGENDITWRDAAATDWPSKTIVTRAAAEALYEGGVEEALGSTVYISENYPMTIVGIVERLQAPWSGFFAVEQSALMPQHIAFESSNYLIRAEPGQRDALMPIVETRLAERVPGRVIQDMATMAATREDSYRGENGIIKVLTFTIAALIAITTLGIAGLTSFRVTQRTKQIGTRRALGATRTEILRYFLTETLLFAAIGVALGAVLAVGINIALVEIFSLPRMPWYLVPIGMVALLAIGLAAVWLPARRAARVPPAVATRTI